MPPPPPQPPSAIVQASGPTDPRQRLINSVRQYVHMDNMVERFNAQAANARELRSKHETETIQLLKQLGLHKSTLQISGGTLHLAQRRVPGSLTWGYLEREIPAWASSAGFSAAQSASLLRWLQEHRDMKETESLIKKESKAADPEMQ